jgi:hypothetical protein
MSDRTVGENGAGYRAIAPLFSASGEERLAPWTTTLIIIAAHGNGLQLWLFDQPERDAYIVKPFLQFAVHITPPLGKYSAANVRTA